MSMNSEIKQEWLDALRSNEYEQAIGMLRSEEGGYCCLGVLCDLAAKHGVGRWESGQFTVRDLGTDVVDWRFTDNSGLEGSLSTLPAHVREWAGLGLEDNPTVSISMGTDTDHDVSLAELNDKGNGFEFIADCIEEQL